MIVLNPADVRDLLPMSDAVELMSTAFRAFRGGAVEQPVRHMVRSPSGNVPRLAAQDVYSGLLRQRRAAAAGVGARLDFADADE